MTEPPTLTLTPLLNLARDLSTLLVPVRPQPGFKEALGVSLVSAARQYYAQQTLEINSPATHRLFSEGALDWRDMIAFGWERRWVVGAAAVGSAVSVAGLVAYLWRQRAQRVA